MTPAALLQFAAEAYEALANREPCEVSDAERRAIYAPRPREAAPYTPEQPDPLRDGLARGARRA